MHFTGQGKSALWFYAWESWESCVSEAIRTVGLYLHEQSQRWWFQHRLMDTARPSPSSRTAGPRLPSGELLSTQVASRSEPRTSKEDHFEWHSNVNLRKVLEIVFFNQNTNTLMSSEFVMPSLIFFQKLQNSCFKAYSRGVKDIICYLSLYLEGGVIGVLPRFHFLHGELFDSLTEKIHFSECTYIFCNQEK